MTLLSLSNVGRTYAIDGLFTMVLRNTQTGEWKVLVYPHPSVRKAIGRVERKGSIWVARGFRHRFQTMQDAVEWVVRDWAHP